MPETLLEQTTFTNADDTAGARAPADRPAIATAEPRKKEKKKERDSKTKLPLAFGLTSLAGLTARRKRLWKAEEREIVLVDRWQLSALLLPV